MDLTSRQQQILELIRRHIRERGAPPTRSEIAQAFGFRSVNAAEEHLRALARKGAIELHPATSRGIRLLVGDESETGGLPVIGQVAAGSPILATEHVEAHYRVAPDLFHPRAHYLLRVRGMSMRDIGILEGDLVAVHQTREALSGQIVVARLEDEVTVKRFWRSSQARHKVRLLPANPDFSPIEVDLREQALTIEGCCVGLLRTFPEAFVEAEPLGRR